MELKLDRSKAKNHRKFKKSPESVKIKGSRDISAPFDTVYSERRLIHDIGIVRSGASSFY